MSEVSEHAITAIDKWASNKIPTLKLACQSAIDSATAELRRELEEVRRKRDGLHSTLQYGIQTMREIEAERDALKRQVEGLRGLSGKLLSRLEPHADEDCQCEACGLQAAINQREK